MTTALRRRFVAAAVGILISVAAVAVLVLNVDVPRAVAVMSRASLPALIGASAIIGVQLCLRALRWRLLLPRGPHGAVARLRGTLAAMLIGYLGNAALPARLGEGARALVLARTQRLSIGPVVVSIVVERIVDTGTLALMALLAAIASAGPHWLILLTATAAAISGLMLAALSLFGLEWLFRIFTAARRRLSPRVGASIPRLRRDPPAAAFAIHRPGDIARAAVLSAMAWALTGGTFWLVAVAVGVESSLPVAFLVAAAAVLATAIPAGPGAIGTFELAAVTTAQAFAIPPHEALAWAILAHVLTVYLVALAGVPPLLILGMTASSRTSRGRTPVTTNSHTRGGPGAARGE